MPSDTKALDIARYIIHHETRAGRGLSHFRLQLLMYFCQGKMIMINRGASLLFDEEFIATEYGPKLLSVRNRYKDRFFFNLKPEGTVKEPEYKDVIVAVLEYAASLSTKELFEIACSQNPWVKTYRRDMDNYISNRILIDYFEGKCHEEDWNLQY